MTEQREEKREQSPDFPAPPQVKSAYFTIIGMKLKYSYRIGNRPSWYKTVTIQYCKKEFFKQFYLIKIPVIHNMFTECNG